MAPTPAYNVVPNYFSATRQVQPKPQVIHPAPRRGRTSSDLLINEPASPSDTISLDYQPYAPPPALHPTIVTDQDFDINTGPNDLSSPLTSNNHHLSPGTVILITLAFFSVILGLAAMLATRMAWRKKRSHRQTAFTLWCSRRKSKSNKIIRVALDQDQEEQMDCIDICGEEPDDPTRLQPFPRPLSGHDGINTTHLQRSYASAQLEPELLQDFGEKDISSIGYLDSGRDLDRHPPQDFFQDRLMLEEDDIALALGMALCENSSQEHFVIVEDPEEYGVELPFPYLEKTQQRQSSPKTRPRQGSDASNETTTTDETAERPTSSSSSMTSLPSFEDSDLDGDLEDEEEDLELADIFFEVKRAQTQSVEIKQGVLISCSASDRRSSPDIHDLVVAPESPKLNPKTFCDWEIELQRGTPSVMVTNPSIASLKDLKSGSSSLTVDLDEFPLPPTHRDDAKAYYGSL